jgi:hypothetical protein
MCSVKELHCIVLALLLAEEIAKIIISIIICGRIFGPKRDEVTGEWKKLHNEELHNLY